MATKSPEPAAALGASSRYASEEPSARASVPPPDSKSKLVETRLRSTSVEPSAAIAAAKSPEPEAEASETESAEPDDDATTIDMETFHQILDLDEDETHDFSRGMAWAYFGQASTTFTEMDEAYEKKDLEKLSALGHFLKGSSAALGVAKVQASCEKIQHYGQLRDEESGKDLTAETALDKIKPLLGKVKVEYTAAEKWLREWYRDNAEGEEPDS